MDEYLPKGSQVRFTNRFLVCNSATGEYEPYAPDKESLTGVILSYDRRMMPARQIAVQCCENGLRYVLGRKDIIEVIRKGDQT